jgi:Rrf2 family protein
MFRISRKLEYGILLMAALAEDPDNKAKSTASLSEKLEIPLPFLHQIAHALMHAKLIIATPGPKGGLKLGRSPDEITALNIAEALDGPISLNLCTETHGGGCGKQEGCPSKDLWCSVENIIIQELASVSLDKMSNN